MGGLRYAVDKRPGAGRTTTRRGSEAASGSTQQRSETGPKGPARACDGGRRRGQTDGDPTMPTTAAIATVGSSLRRRQTTNAAAAIASDAMHAVV